MPEDREALVERGSKALEREAASAGHPTTTREHYRALFEAALAVVEAEQGAPKTHAFWDGTKFTTVYEGESPDGRWMPYA